MWVMWPTFFVLWPAFAAGAYASVQTYELFVGALSAVVLLYGGWPFLIGAWRAALRAARDDGHAGGAGHVDRVVLQRCGRP